jgi:hypothetical protein
MSIRKIKLKIVMILEEKVSHKRQEEYGNMTRKRSSGKTDTDGKAWLQEDLEEKDEYNDNYKTLHVAQTVNTEQLQQYMP